METNITSESKNGIFRAFVSADVEKSEKILSLLKGLQKTNADLKLVNPESIHITLKFLGDTPESIVPDITEIIRKSVLGIPPFALKFRGMGAFPNLNRINVVWVGIFNPEQLTRIADLLDDKLAGLGFRKEGRRFSPHLTLARVKSPRNIEALQRLIAENRSIDCGDIAVESIRLKKSALTPAGPVYSTIAEIKLE